MKLRSAGLSDVGLKREANEDFFAIDEAAGLFVVADGLGGHVAGRVASELAVERFLDLMRPSNVGNDRDAGSDFDYLRGACVSAHRAILDRAASDPRLQGMGTTLAALWFREGRVSLAHVGDSRIYVFRDQKLHALTFDHSLVNEMVFRGALTRSQARIHPYRHVITRALGVGDAIEPDTVELRAQVGDVYLLCSDGITGQIEHDELAQVLLAGGSDLDAAAQQLIEIANDSGGNDNATAVLVQYLG
jgi:protein phosphatase